MMTPTLLLLLLAHVTASVDMSATFAKLKTCKQCTQAGYGWCSIKRRCGGFANKECGVGPNYVAEDYLQMARTAKKPADQPPPTAFPSQRGTDMRATFAKLRDCGTCVAAGYGWCPMQRKCGGFANKECGLGPNYVAAGTPPSTTSSSQLPRNGLWESKEQRAAASVADAPPAAEVPQASPPPPAGLLYAGPVERTTTELQTAAAVDPVGRVTIAASVASSNASSGKQADDEQALMGLPQEALVAKVLELQMALQRQVGASTAS